jgi:hypothetical protein
MPRQSQSTSPSAASRRLADASENGLSHMQACVAGDSMPHETSSPSYTQNGSTDDPFQLHGLSLIHRVSDTRANARRFLRDFERACSLRIRTILTPFRDIAAQYPVGQWTTEKSLLTVCLVCINGRKAGSTSSTSSARHWTSNTGWPRQDHHKPTALLSVIAGNHLPGNGWSGSTDASRMCCKATISNQAKSWRPRGIATSGSTTSNSRDQPCAVRRPCKS